ncbi:hypothetical protein H4I96_07721 [Botrytis cinerea]
MQRATILTQAHLSHLSRLFTMANRLNYCFFYLSLIISIYTRVLPENTPLLTSTEMPLQVLPLVENLQKISQRFLEEIGLRSANPAPLPPPNPRIQMIESPRIHLQILPTIPPTTHHTTHPTHPLPPQILIVSTRPPPQTRNPRSRNAISVNRKRGLRIFISR